MCVTERRPDADGFMPVAYGRRMQQPQLGDFITTPVSKQPPKAGSRFRPLTLEDWHQIASETAICAKGAMQGSADLVAGSVDFADSPCAGSAVLFVDSADSNFPFCVF